MKNKQESKVTMKYLIVALVIAFSINVSQACMPPLKPVELPPVGYCVGTWTQVLVQTPYGCHWAWTCIKSGY